MKMLLVWKKNQFFHLKKCNEKYKGGGGEYSPSKIRDWLYKLVAVTSVNWKLSFQAAVPNTSQWRWISIEESMFFVQLIICCFILFKGLWNQTCHGSPARSVFVCSFFFQARWELPGNGRQNQSWLLPPGHSPQLQLIPPSLHRHLSSPSSAGHC